jgi:flagellar assembly factor FliW
MVMILDKTSCDRSLDLLCGVMTTPLKLSEANAAEPATYMVQTSRFGVLDVPEDLVITFPEGIIGFEQCRRYVILHNDDRSDFRWLQSLDSPSIAFPILNPNTFRPDYAPTISDIDAVLLGLTETCPMLGFTIVTIPANNPRGMTANLLAPLVINPETHEGKQVIVQDEGFATRHSVLEEIERSRVIATAAPSSHQTDRGRKSRAA